jgi:hypothetical protein
MSISKRVEAAIVGRMARERNLRLQEWQERWEEVRDALDSIMAERGEDLKDVPGGSTGFLARI